MALVAQQADGAGPHPFELRVQLQDQEDLQQRERRQFEHLVVGDLQIVVARLEVAIDRHHFGGLIAQQDGFFEQLQQQLIETRQLHDRLVVGLHELLDRQRVLPVHETHLCGHPALVIKQQAVFTPAADAVQDESDLPQKILAFDQRLVFRSRQETVRDQILQGIGPEVAFGDPPDHLDVTQTAGTLLYIGFQVVGAVVVFVVALALFFALGLEELAACPDQTKCKHPRLGN